MSRRFSCYLIMIVTFNIITVSAPANDTRIPREVAIIDFKWISVRANPDPPDTLHLGPIAALATLSAPDQTLQNANSLNRTIPAIGISRASMISPEAMEAQRASPDPSYFQYSVRLKNLNAQAIRSVVWEYVFKDTLSGEEFGRVRFRSETAIKPGQTKQIHGYTRMPPTRVVSVRALQAKTGQAAGESIEIVRVSYADPVAQQ